MPPTEVGRRAEAKVATQLAQNGYRILDRNWRTRWCEIDLVAQKDQIIHFIEVKYRRNDRYGGGEAAITPARLQRMRRAALSWLQHHNRLNSTYRLDVAVVNGTAAPLFYPGAGGD